MQSVSLTAQRYRRLSWLAISTANIFVLVAAAPAEAESRGSPTAVLFATFNVSLNRFNAVDLISDLSTPGNTQAQAVGRDHPADPARRGSPQRVRLRLGR